MKFRPLQPRSLEIAYYRDIMKTVDAWSEAVIRYRHLLPSGKERTDDAFSDFWSLFQQRVTDDWAAVAGTINVSQRFDEVSLFNWGEWRKQVKAGTKFELPATQPWRETGLDILSHEWVDKNVDLIKGFKEQRDRQLRDAVFNAVTRGRSREQLIKEILPNVEKLNETTAGATKLTAAQRADLIATDQILTANAQLNTQRMINAAVSYYIWRGMDDARERPAHVKLNDHYFRVDGKPMTDADYAAIGVTARQPDTPGNEVAPGVPVRCRCYAEAVFAGSLYDFTPEEQSDFAYSHPDRLSPGLWKEVIGQTTDLAVKQGRASKI